MNKRTSAPIGEIKRTKDDNNLKVENWIYLSLKNRNNKNIIYKSSAGTFVIYPNELQEFFAHPDAPINDNLYFDFSQIVASDGVNLEIKGIVLNYGK